MESRMHTISHINYTVPNTTDPVPTTVRLGPTSKSWGENRFCHCLNGEKKQDSKAVNKEINCTLRKSYTQQPKQYISYIHYNTMCYICVCVHQIKYSTPCGLQLMVAWYLQEWEFSSLTLQFLQFPQHTLKRIIVIQFNYL